MAPCDTPPEALVIQTRVLVANACDSDAALYDTGTETWKRFSFKTDWLWRYAEEVSWTGTELLAWATPGVGDAQRRAAVWQQPLPS
jgi:hypothetical protein